MLNLKKLRSPATKKRSIRTVRTSEPILLPKLQNQLAEFPYTRVSKRPEASNLGGPREISTSTKEISRDGLNPAHVPYQWVNNPTLCSLCFTMLGRADIEESESNVALNAWLPQASYPCGNFSDTFDIIRKLYEGSISHAFASHNHT